MHITELKTGQHATRKHTNGSTWGRGKGLTITKTIYGDLLYCTGGIAQSKVRSNSSAYDYDDFYLCDERANPINIQNQQQGKIMNYNNTNVIATTENGKLMVFENDENARRWIASELEKNNNQKFKVWAKPTYEVKPKPVDLSGLITML